MKKKLWTLLLCVLLLAQLAMPSAGAAQDVCFVGAGEYILALNEETMPFWYNGYLYISSTIFTGVARDALGISRGYDKRADAVVLYTSEEEALVFEMSKNYAWDSDEKVYTPGAIRRSDTVFVPVALVAKYFDLQYSYISVPRGYLVWLRKPDLQLPDKVFADAANGPMEDRYEEYRKAAGIQDTELTPAVPEAAITGKVVYLCMEAGEDTSAVMDALGRYSAQAAFFCDTEFLETRGDLLRRMTATGQSIGLLVDGKNADASVTEQAAQANEALERATCGRTRLVRLENGTEADKEALRAAGYRCLEEDLDRSGSGLRTAAQADTLQQRIAARKGNCAVWLGERVGVTGLQAFLRTATEEEGRCLAWTETA